MEVWGWLIAIYLFLGGVGAGAYLTSLAADQGVFGHAPQLKRIGYIISAPVVGSGAGILVLDLGQGLHKPWLLIGLLSNPHSVMSWGTGILSVFICLGLVRGFLAWRNKRAPKWLDYAGAMFAVATAVYTGMLLAAVKAIPFWHNYLLPLLFLISALSTGMSATTAIAQFLEKEQTDHRPVCLAHVVLVGAELIILVTIFTLIFSGLFGPIALQSGTMLLFDRFAAVFWLLLVCLGLVGPLSLYIYNHKHHAGQLAAGILPNSTDNPKSPVTIIKMVSQTKYLVCDMAVLIGGLSLRCLFIFAAIPVWNGILS